MQPDQQFPGHNSMGTLQGHINNEQAKTTDAAQSKHQSMRPPSVASETLSETRDFDWRQRFRTTYRRLGTKVFHDVPSIGGKSVP